MDRKHASQSNLRVLRSGQERGPWKREVPREHQQASGSPGEREQRSSSTQVQPRIKKTPGASLLESGQKRPHDRPLPRCTLAGSDPGTHTCCGGGKLEGGPTGRGPVPVLPPRAEQKNKAVQGVRAEPAARGAPFQDSPAPSCRSRFQ